MNVTSSAIDTEGRADARSKYLRGTRCINLDHPHVAAEAARLAAGAGSPAEIAVRMHDFVRDAVAFGWTRSFYDMTASDVLTARVGYCNTKATLFVALLRAAGIPARQRFVNIRAELLAPFLTPPQDYVDHSYTEVLLDGRWVGTDSYLLDGKLYGRARAQLARQGLKLGYGLHHRGTNRWDGRQPAFAQYVQDGDVENLSTRDYGVYPDTAAFYAEGHRPESLTGVQRFLIPLLIDGADAKVRAFRDRGA